MKHFEVLYLGPVYDAPTPPTLAPPRYWKLDQVRTAGDCGKGRAGDQVSVVLRSLDGMAIYGEPFEEFCRFWRPIVVECGA